MRIRRCAHLMIELDHEPRFDVAMLLAGGDGLDRSSRWLAYAPHLGEPVPVTLATLAVLQALPRDDWTPVDALAAGHGDDTLQALLASGLVIRDDAGFADDRARDDAVRDVAWWTPALVAQAHGGWEAVDIEDRRGRGLTMSSAQMVDAFGAAPDPDVRVAAGTAVVPLATPEHTAFDDLLQARRTCRNFDPAATLPATAFATMMRRVWGAFGTKELAPGAVAVKKNSPAGGGLHAVEAYVVAQRVEGVAPGIYHYLAMAHALEPLRPLASPEAKALAHRFVAGQDWFEDAPVLVVMVARFDRLFWKYRRHKKAWRVVHLDVGHLSQTMYLSATELGLGAFVTAAINDRVVEAELGLPPLREGAIALVGFGPRAPSMRTMELDVFEPVQPPGAPLRGSPSSP